VILAICYDKDISWKRKYDGKDEGVIDIGIVATHMMLQITESGLASTIVGAFDPTKAMEILDIPENYQLENLLPFGYPSPDGQPSPKHFERRPIEEIVYWDSFDNK